MHVVNCPLQPDAIVRPLHRGRHTKKVKNETNHMDERSKKSIKMHSNDKMIELPSGVVIFQENNEDSSI